MRRLIEQRNRAIELRKMGKSIKSIAKEIEVSPSAVSLWVRHIKLTAEQRSILAARSAAHLPKRVPGILSMKRRRMGEAAWKEYQQKKKKEYDSKYNKKSSQVFYRENRKRELIKYKGGACKVCGYAKDCPPAFVFHHRDPDGKDYGISQKNYSIERLKREIDKCDLYCTRCHTEEHYRIWQAQKQEAVTKGKEITPL